VRWQTGKGANLALFYGANMALCSRREKRARLSFPDSLFFGYFLLKEQKKVTINQKKIEDVLLRHPLLLLR